jgi:hypothetical protein
MYVFLISLKKIYIYIYMGYSNQLNVYHTLDYNY